MLAYQEASDNPNINQLLIPCVILEFLTTLYLCYQELDKRFAVVGSRKVTKQTRVEATVLNSLTPVSKSDIARILPDVSITTIEAVLGKMVNAGQIRKIGTGRGTRYIKLTEARYDIAVAEEAHAEYVNRISSSAVPLFPSGSNGASPSVPLPPR